jgi:hypothetical protein
MSECVCRSGFVHARRRITKSSRDIASGLSTFPSTVLGQGGELVRDACPGRGDDRRRQQSKDQRQRATREKLQRGADYGLEVGKEGGRAS